MARAPKKASRAKTAATDAVIAGSRARVARNLEVWPIDRLVPYARNARTHSPAQVRQIAGSIARFGFNSPILVDGKDGIVAGHGRLLAARELGLVEVPVVVLDHLSELERRAYLLADNQLAQLAGWDDAMLAAELSELELAGLAPDVMGFDRTFQDNLAREVAGTAGVVDVPPETPPQAPLSRPGDLWVVGRHRVLCGDSRKPADVERALAGVRADAVVTDPPYGVEYVGGTSAALRIKNDDAAGLAKLLEAALGAALTHSRPGAPWYVFGPSGGEQFLDFIQTLHKLQVWHQTLVWVKDRLVLGRSDYHYRHENCFFGWAPGDPREHLPEDPDRVFGYEHRHESLFYGWSPGGPHRKPHERNWDTVWEFPRPAASRDHPTMKPLDLVAQCVEHAAAPGRLVLDLFGGSGTTALACQLLGRRSATVEFDPRYVDVIVRRLSQSAGLEAVLEGSGEWARVREERG